MRATLTRERRKAAGLAADKAELEKQIKALDDKLADQGKDVSRKIATRSVQRACTRKRRGCACAHFF
jgi:hypothetical protein